MNPRDTKEWFESVGDSFFYQRVHEALTDTLPKGFEHRRDEYFDRTIGMMNEAIKACEVNQIPGDILLGRYMENGHNVLETYLMIKEVLPKAVMSQWADDQTFAKVLNGFRQTLVNLKAHQTVSDKDRSELLALERNLGESAKSKASSCTYKNLFHCSRMS
jgi:hypothetical protein